MTAVKRTLKEDEVSLTIDLEDLFGVDVSDKPEIKQAVGQAIIDKIVSRTGSGKGVDGGKFQKYSESYTESLAFKAAGKSKDSVNLKLFGDMLGTLDVLSDEGNKLKIGWDDELQNAKAYNHNTGDTLPKREFFGLSDSEVKEIKNEFIGEAIGRVALDIEATSFEKQALGFLDALSRRRDGEG